MDDNEIGIGPHVKCAATIKSPFSHPFETLYTFLPCALSPVDEHTTHQTINATIVWEGNHNAKD